MVLSMSSKNWHQISGKQGSIYIVPADLVVAILVECMVETEGIPRKIRACSLRSLRLDPCPRPTVNTAGPTQGTEESLGSTSIPVV